VWYLYHLHLWKYTLMFTQWQNQLRMHFSTHIPIKNNKKSIDKCRAHSALILNNNECSLKITNCSNCEVLVGITILKKWSITYILRLDFFFFRTQRHWQDSCLPTFHQRTKTNIKGQEILRKAATTPLDSHQGSVHQPPSPSAFYSLVWQARMGRRP
jgi:hypothetical protein